MDSNCLTDMGMEAFVGLNDICTGALAIIHKEIQHSSRYSQSEHR
jgi:hypothetical protein